MKNTRSLLCATPPADRLTVDKVDKHHVWRIRLESDLNVVTRAYITLPMRKIGSVRILSVPSVVVESERSDRNEEPMQNSIPRRPSTITCRRTKSECVGEPSTVSTQPHTARHLELVSQYALVKPRNVHVLLAEDNAINRTIAIRAIRKLGFSVAVVWNGKEALDHSMTTSSLSRLRANFVLMDCQMQVMDGYAATRALRHEKPDVRNERISKVLVTAVCYTSSQRSLLLS